jgi:hypothetical protein
VLGTAIAWRALLALALHLEWVFGFENAVLTLLLAVHRPADLDALRALRLHAGLDLVWHPGSQTLTALLEAANVFVVWWAVLLGLALAPRLGGRQAALLAAASGTALVVLRAGFASH